MNKNIGKIEYSNDMVALKKFVKALSHTTRILILQHHENQSCCFTGDLVDALPISQSTVCQHLKELKNASLIQGELKPTKIKYYINQRNWKIAKAYFKIFFV